jgi:hypothetical protein
LTQTPRPNTFRIFWPFVSSHHKYISLTCASCNFTPRSGLIDWTRQAGVDTQYCLRAVSADSVRGPSTDRPTDDRLYQLYRPRRTPIRKPRVCNGLKYVYVDTVCLLRPSVRQCECVISVSTYMLRF